VEGGEPQGATDDEQKYAEPGRAAQVLERVGVQEKRRRHAERDDVGQRVELYPDLAGRLHQAGHPAVEQVHDHRDKDRQRRVGVPPLDREQEREEAAEEVAGREQARQQDDAPPPLVAQLVPAPPPRSLTPSDHRHASNPSSVTPPRTRSPTRTRTSVPRGMQQSVREPNRIMPKRSPTASLSPGATRQTIRRAKTPAICVTVTRALSPCRWTMQRSLPAPASGLYAGTKRPSEYTTPATRPPMGARFTCTSSGERKIATRTAGPTNGSLTSSTCIPRPSAGARAPPGIDGTSRSGSRKNPREASDAAAKGAARPRRPARVRSAAIPAGVANDGAPPGPIGERVCTQS